MWNCHICSYTHGSRGKHVDTIDMLVYSEQMSIEWEGRGWDKAYKVQHLEMRWRRRIWQNHRMDDLRAGRKSEDCAALATKEKHVSWRKCCWKIKWDKKEKQSIRFSNRRSLVTLKSSLSAVVGGSVATGRLWEPLFQGAWLKTEREKRDSKQ